MIFIMCAFLFISFSDLSRDNNPESPASRDIVLEFVTYNGYGNNLYIDNVMTGIQKEYDITVTSVINIPYDTSYAFFPNGEDTISPQVTVTNIGRLAADSVKVYLTINFPEYIDSAFYLLMANSETVTPTFKKYTATVGTPMLIRAYTFFRADSNTVNDLFNQYSIILPGYRRNVLYEEFTSNASPACANNNPGLDEFVNLNIGSVCAIKYHLPLGSSGVDSFYLQNPVQNQIRWRYYYNQSVPYTIADGRNKVLIPYGDSSNLYTPYYQRLNYGTPVNITVQDENAGEDSVRALINVNISSSLQQGNYRLRINAVERYIQSTAANGETNFFDVFREFYPDSSGIEVPRAAGNYEFSYTYYKQPYWIDSMLYTTVYIQNDDTKEIMNCAKSRNITLSNTENTRRGTSGQIRSEVLYSYSGKRETLIADSIQTALNLEMFEAYFPPLGWKVFNQDGFITFKQYSGVNGPSFGGTKSVIMNFFDYNFPGQRDSMYSKRYTGLLASDTVRFDYAYAQYSTNGYIDSLIVRISTDGGQTFPSEIFRKGGLNLATAPQTSQFFIPTNFTQWKTFSFPLSSFVDINNNSTNIIPGYSLNQNYPNPFNPATNINYEIPLRGTVSLIVYDMLGKETAVLVNEIQQAGKYSVSFNAGNLPSGVYFCTLKTEGFTDTKKMILLK